MPSKSLKSTLLMCFAAAIAGCGGGGGGGTPPPAPEPTPPPPVPFHSFQDIQPNQTVAMTGGISQTASGTADMSGTITSATLGPVDTANSTATLSYDPLLALHGASIATPQSNVSFSAPGDMVTCTTGVCDLSSSTADAVVIDGRGVGWNYQTFGLWATAPTATTWLTGAISVGNPTPASAVPTTGTATFTGLAAGLYIDPMGAIFGTAANMTANVDFSARSIGFGTSSTMVTDTNGIQSSNSNIDLSGTLTYAAGTNQFSGSVQTSDKTLNGSATGKFYGPNAEEIGGVYGLSAGTGVSGMLGAFGGKR